MPITSKVDKTKNLTIYTLTGELTLDEILDALKSFWEAHTLTVNLLWDARSAKLSQLKIFRMMDEAIKWLDQDE